MTALTSKKFLPLMFVIVSLPLWAAGCFSITPSKQDGGVFRSNDGGLTWQQKVFVQKLKNKDQTIDNVSVNALVRDPNDTNTLYLSSANSGIFKTVNAGDSWSATGITSGNWPVLAIDPTSSALLYAGSGGTIVKSSDAGKTWNTIYVETRSNQSVAALAVDPNDPQRLLAGMNTGLIVESRDYGATWKVLGLLSGSARKILLFRGQDLAYAMGGAKLFKSGDRGNTWTEIKVAVGNTAANVNEPFFLADTPDFIAVASNLGFLRSFDQGKTWQDIQTLTSEPTPLNIDRVAVNPLVRTELYAIIGNRFHISLDDGKTWTVKVLPTSRRVSAFDQSLSDPQIIYVGTFATKKK